jgi:Asp-tRNA(Asn)/Glu-tRNA(Gln) amidotransferase A subunit family amidase
VGKPVIVEGRPPGLTATGAAAEIARGALSAEEVARACLDRIAAVDGDVQAFVHLDPAHVLAQARALDGRRRSGLATGPLHGIPVAVKDIFDTEDYPTESGSALFAGRRPRRDAAVVARLRAAGAVILGKTVTTELAYFHPGKTRNPRDLERTPGGSSSGSAAAVAAGMAPLALGSQTNGSVIRPAAFCGVVGFKPTHGLIPRTGALLLSPALDHVGVFGWTLEDVALLLEVLAGADGVDADARPVGAPRFRAVLAEPPPLPPSFAFVRTPIWDKADADTRAAFETLVERLGAAATAVELPERYRGAWDAHRAIMAADMAHRFGPLVERASEDAVSPRFRALVEEGRTVSAVRYLAAVEEGRALAEGLREIFDRHDAILTPATVGVAPRGLASTGDPAFCTLWTLTGLPAVSLPLLECDGLPLGVQLVGTASDDARLLRTARILSQMLTGKKATGRRAS